jgi:hypothetical protein
MSEWACIAHLNIWNTSYGQKKGRESKLPIWLLTTKSQESTQFTWLQRAFHIPLESSRQGLQLCLRSHLDLRFARKVMRLQSHGSPNWHDFGTPIREVSGEKNHLDVGLWPATKYTIRGKLPPSPGHGESSVFVLLVARPSTKGASTMH